jgi:hypothetical protein
MPLFDNPPDPDCLRAMRHSESKFSYYECCSRPKVLRVRAIIDQLFDEYPDGQHKNALAADMRSSGEAFDSAFFELFLHGFLSRLGCVAQPEPLLGSLGASRPDFLVTLPSGAQFYLEAVLVTGASEAKRARDRVLHQLYDYINDNLQSPKFFWRIEIDQDGSHAPSSRRIVGQLQRHVATLDWDHLASFTDAPRSAMIAIEKAGIAIESNGWRFSFEPIPKKREAFEKGGRPLGWFPMEGGVSLTQQQLRDRISTKRKQHGVLDKPLVIAIDALQADVDDEDFFGAIYGSEVFEVTFRGSAPISTRLKRAKDGAWLDVRGPKHSHIPYVLGFEHLVPNTVASASAVAFLNPWIEPDQNLCLPRIPTMSLSSDGVIRQPGEGLQTVFGLPEGWPAQEDHERRSREVAEMTAALQAGLDNWP